MDMEKNYDRKEMFSIFIKTINYKKKTENRKVTSDPKYIKKLFSIFDENNLDDSACKNWLAKQNIGFMKCFTETNFSADKYQACFDFFKKEINSNFKDVQANLYTNAIIFDYVDFITANAETFYCSLIKQFLFIVYPSIIEDDELNNFINTYKSNETNETVFDREIDSLDANVQMRNIFYNALSKYNIAYYINNLKKLLDSRYLIQTQTCSDYPDELRPLLELYYPMEALYNPYNSFIDNTDATIINLSKDIDTFRKDIDIKILTKFIPFQDETTYILIKEFSNALHNFHGVFDMLDANISEEFSEYYSQCDNIDLLRNKCCEEIDTVKNNIFEIQNKDSREDLEHTQYTENAGNTDDILANLQNREMKLHFLLTMLSCHAEMCSLYEKLSDGKSILKHT